MKRYFVRVFVDLDDGRKVIYQRDVVGEAQAHEIAIRLLESAVRSGYPAERLLAAAHEEYRQ